MLVAIDLDSYRREAEQFVGAVDREYYLHFSGQKPSFELEPIFARHRELFGAAVVAELRDRCEAAAGDQRRSLLYLLRLCVDGLIGEATKAQTVEFAEREGDLRVELDGDSMPYRAAAVRQASEPDAARRAAIERARLGALDSELNPLLVEIVECSHALARQLGWSSYLAMYSELKGYDLAGLERQTRAFLSATEPLYEKIVDPVLERQLGYGLDSLRRCDIPYLLRAPDYDRWFKAERLLDAFKETLVGMGLDPSAQTNVTLDLASRPTKSPRAFCSPVHVPDEIYLVMPVGGGREDFATLLHEGGHVQHYAHVDRSLPFEFRHLGDNSVTESYAFLFENLTENRAWLRSRLGVEGLDDYGSFTRAAKLIFLRRYAAKLAYELQLRCGRHSLGDMPLVYSNEVGGAVGIEWPETTYLADVDDGFYVANYLRAWALETYLRRSLRERFGDAWFEFRQAGEFLRGIWSQGQRLNADELLYETLGERLDFAVMLEEYL